MKKSELKSIIKEALESNKVINDLVKIIKKTNQDNYFLIIPSKENKSFI